MPKTATYALIWSADQETYLWRDGDGPAAPGAGEAWTAWLAAQRSFAFQGRAGRLTLLKEARQGGVGYWYAYRRQGRQTRKHYAGRSEDLTLARLEAIAAALNPPASGPATPFVPQAPGIPARPGGEDAGPQEIALQPREPAPLLAPKLQPPRLHSGLIRRARLLAQLDAGLERRLIVVNAPAGCGKTTLVRQWLTEREGQPGVPTVGWVALDPRDNDPLRFWRYAITACGAFLADRGQAALDALDAPPRLSRGQSPVEATVTTLLNTWTASGHDGLLVFEDYHAITAPQIHETLAFLLDHLPVTGHVLIITRQNPPLPLARWQGAGNLTELYASDLLFTADETRAFLQATTPVPLTANLLREVAMRVEGWPAGLRLLAAMLAGQTDHEAVETITRGFAGTHQRIQEYVVSEFFSELPAPVQSFVLETSVLTRLTPALCAAITGRANSAELLAALDRGNVLLEPLDNAGLWYRYHSLLAGAMQEEARRRLGADTLRDLSRRASRWYADHQMPAEAIEASLAAEDMEQAARLILSICNSESLLIGSHLLPQVPGFHTLRRWLDTLPDPIFAAYPALWPIQAMALLFVFLLDMMRPPDAVQAQIEDCLDKAERAFRAAGHRAGLGEVFAFRSMLHRQRGDFTMAAQYAHEALGLLPADDRAARAISYNAIGFLEVHSGQVAAAEQALRAAQTLCERLGNHAFVRANMGMLSWALYEHGKLHESATLLRRMLVEARAQGDLDDVVRAQQLLGSLSYQWNDLDQAQNQIAESLRLSASFAHADDALMGAELVQAQIEAARGAGAAALARCARLIARLEHYTDPAQYHMYRRARAMQARLHLASGDLAAAQHWAAGRDPLWTEIPAGDQAHEQRILIRLLIATDQAAAALPLIEAALQTAHATGHMQAARETQVLLALAHSALKHPPEARQALQATLAAAYPEGAIRLFVDEGEPLAALLRSLLPTLEDKALLAYARAILRAFTADAGAPVADLSAQERRVLRLLAAGRSNPEIAGDLVVSINTVKAHIKHIYSKLDVTSRREAGAAAQRLGLT